MYVAHMVRIIKRRVGDWIIMVYAVRVPQCPVLALLI